MSLHLFFTAGVLQKRNFASVSCSINDSCFYKIGASLQNFSRWMRIRPPLASLYSTGPKTWHSSRLIWLWPWQMGIVASSRKAVLVHCLFALLENFRSRTVIVHLFMPNNHQLGTPSRASIGAHSRKNCFFSIAKNLSIFEKKTSSSVNTVLLGEMQILYFTCAVAINKAKTMASKMYILGKRSERKSLLQVVK